MFFDMPKYDAIKALDVYKRAGLQAEDLAEFSDFCKHLELARTFQLPTLRQDSEERKLLGYSPKAPKEPEEPAEEEREEPTEPEQEPEPKPQPQETTGDLPNLDAEVHPLVAELEESNALALAIVGPGEHNKASISYDLFDRNASGWELALVTAPSTHTSQAADSKLAGGFDKLLLDSLYEDEARRPQIASATYTGSLGSGAANPLSSPVIRSPCPAASRHPLMCS